MINTKGSHLARVVLVSLVSLLGLTMIAPAGIAQSRGISDLPEQLKPYDPDSQEWADSPWMAMPACRDRGGDFAVWVAYSLAATPTFLRHYQPSLFGDHLTGQDLERRDAILQGFQDVALRTINGLPGSLCVADARQWATPNPAMKPFGFAWGTSADSQSDFACTDRALTSRRQHELNRNVGAERLACDGFAISCTAAPEEDLERCAEWNSLSDRYVESFEAARADAIGRYPAAVTVAPTTTEINWRSLTYALIGVAVLLVLGTASAVVIIRRKRRARQGSAAQ
ncbi:hypothetical protein GCM10022247_34970 [Allokutzneria multivorans]|uniref:Uncharacterized protein n=1 Tax=Allokutzneria multivorans TaxID=1142134 RepID=A0ABP7SCI7_9PSEU